MSHSSVDRVFAAPETVRAAHDFASAPHTCPTLAAPAPIPRSPTSHKREPPCFSKHRKRPPTDAPPAVWIRTLTGHRGWRRATARRRNPQIGGFPSEEGQKQFRTDCSYLPHHLPQLLSSAVAPWQEAVTTAPEVYGLCRKSAWGQNKACHPTPPCSIQRFPGSKMAQLISTRWMFRP